MTGGGFTRLPGGSVVVALSLPRPQAQGEGRRVRVLVHAVNRQRALTGCATWCAPSTCAAT